MTTPTPGASDAPPASPAEANRPPDHGTPGSLPWEAAARELAQSLGPGSTAEVVRRACEQWARYACENWRRHDAEMHKALAAGESERAALTGAPAADTGGKEPVV